MVGIYNGILWHVFLILAREYLDCIPFSLLTLSPALAWQKTLPYFPGFTFSVSLQSVFHIKPVFPIQMPSHFPLPLP